MKKRMSERYPESAIVGTYPLCNWGGLVFFEPDEDHKFSCDFIVAESYGDGLKNYSRHNIHYSARGRAYIIRCRRKIYLDEAMSTRR